MLTHGCHKPNTSNKIPNQGLGTAIHRNTKDLTGMLCYRWYQELFSHQTLPYCFIHEAATSSENDKIPILPHQTPQPIKMLRLYSRVEVHDMSQNLTWFNHFSAIQPYKLDSVY